MKKQIAVSIENESVKLVYAQTGRGGMFVEKTLTFTNDEFDRFLASTRDDEFIAVQNFQNIYQDVISLPPAGDKYLRQLVELEIRKRVPDLKDFAFFYEELREVQREGKRSKDVFFFAVEKADVEEVLERFTRHGKVVTHVYPNVLTLSRFIRVEDGEPGEPILGVLDVGTNKAIFLVRENRLHFVRVAQSNGRGIDQIDVENINMTVSYCRQTLRMNPSRVVLLGMAGDMELPVSPIIPVAPVKSPPGLLAFNEITNEYVAPLSAIACAREVASSSLLPGEFRDLVVQRKVMSYAILVLALLSLLGLGYLGFQSMEVVRSKAVIAGLRKDIGTRQSVIGEFEKALAGVRKFVPSVELANSMSSNTDLQKTLASMQVLAADGVDISSVGLKNEKDFVLIEVQGVIQARNYEDLQTRYENFLAAIKKTGKMEVETQKLDLKERGFAIGLKWKV